MDLLNLIWPDRNYPAPEVTVNMSGNGSAPCAPPPRLMVVGGSFLTAIGKILDKSRCGIEIDYWFYFAISYDRFPERIAEPMTPEVARERDRKLLEGADIILFEENEQLVARSGHFPPFFQLFEPHLASLSRRVR
jgi:hypothetical protein